MDPARNVAVITLIGNEFFIVLPLSLVASLAVRSVAVRSSVTLTASAVGR